MPALAGTTTLQILDHYPALLVCLTEQADKGAQMRLLGRQAGYLVTEGVLYCILLCEVCCHTEAPFENLPSHFTQRLRSLAYLV